VGWVGLCTRCILNCDALEEVACYGVCKPLRNVKRCSSRAFLNALSMLRAVRPAPPERGKAYLERKVHIHMQVRIP